MPLKNIKNAENYRTISEMPGPPPVDNVLGNLEDLREAGDLARFQLKIHEEYGSLVCFSLGSGIKAVSISDPIILRKYANIHKKPEILYQFLEPLLGKVFIEDPDDEVRDLIKLNFTRKLIGNNWDLVDELLNDEIMSLLNSRKEDGTVKLQQKIKTLSMRITVSLIFGIDFNTIDNSAILAEQMHTTLEQLLNFQYDKPEKDREKLDNALNYINENVEKLIKSASREKSTFFHTLLNKIDLEKDREKFKNVIKLVLMGGYHTTASAIGWTLYSIAKDPKISKKVYAEIDSVTLNKPLRYDTLSSLKFLSKTIRESMRLYPPGPYTAREAEEELKIDGYIIPKGTILYYPILVVHRDPKLWGEDSLLFNPDRKFNADAYMPFGRSIKNCNGQNIADTLIKLVTARLVKQITFEVAPGFEPELCENFVLISKNDLMFSLKPRNNEVRKGVFSNQFIMASSIGILSYAYLTGDFKAYYLLALLWFLKLYAQPKFSFFNQNIASRHNEEEEERPCKFAQSKELFRN